LQERGDQTVRRAGHALGPRAAQRCDDSIWRTLSIRPDAIRSGLT
jgi:hypothetical protein